MNAEEIIELRKGAHRGKWWTLAVLYFSVVGVMYYLLQPFDAASYEGHSDAWMALVLMGLFLVLGIHALIMGYRKKLYRETDGKNAQISSAGPW